MESSSNIPGSSPGDDDHHMSVEETDAVTPLKETARQRARLAGKDAPLQKRVPPTFIKYDPSLHSAAFDSMKSRLVSLSETPLDPLVPPKFKSKRVPRPGRSSPPTPVMSSPPRPPSWNVLQEWKVPPCISGWKNRRGEGQGGRSDAVRRADGDEGQVGGAAGAGAASLRRLAASARAERAAKVAAPPAPPVSVTEDPDDEKPKAKHGESDICGARADEQLEKVTKKTDEGTPARAAGKRERPVELDEPEESDDPFDLDQFMAKVKKGDEH
ncbi:hypothetical protein ACQ4PT_008778 [Festuca glaucescens]